ncbi:MAG TPA: hypothetical protein VD862_03880 [Candidatus Paceibacterota bacterium]|nr:hypothetical protein [Candidatus Paceibacterota bacterium]
MRGKRKPRRGPARRGRKLSNRPAPPPDLSTDAGKAFALRALQERITRAGKEKRVDNSSLYAGSPMYYYCGMCGGLSDVLPESHSERPRRRCGPCQEMLNAGYSEELRTFTVPCPSCGGSGKVPHHPTEPSRRSVTGKRWKV